MKLSKLTINNFRGIKSCEIFFKQHQVILGQNNAGKSAIIDAIGLLLGRERLAQTLGDYDFFGGAPKPEDRIYIKGLLTGFSDNLPASNPEWFNDHSGGIPVWFKESTNEVFSGEQPADTVLAVQIAICARFDHEELEYETLRYFDFGEESDPFENTSLSLVRSHSHLKELGFYLVPSKRTWDRTMSFNSDLFKKVLKFQEAIPGETIVKLRDELRSPENSIEDQEPLKEIVSRLSKELGGFFSSADSGISFLPTKGDVEGVLDALTPFVQGHDNTPIPIGKHGSGLISLQTLLLLLEFGRFRNESQKNFFLCAEEPELHLQPGIHRRLVGRIRGLSGQSIITTHSPEVASYYKPEEILVLNNNNGNVKVAPLLKQGLAIGEANAINKLYSIYRKDVCEALMNDKVIIPEGLTEFKWCRLLMNIGITAEGWESYHSLTEQTKSFGIVPTQNSHVELTYKKCSELFHEIVPIVDGDAAGDNYIRSLLVLTPAPKTILRIGNAMQLEDIIEWIINPLETGRMAELEAIASFANSTFRALLDKYKLYEAYHEALAEFMLSKPDCVKRARFFINSIHSTEYNATTGWQKNESKSNTVTAVYDFTFPALNG